MDERKKVRKEKGREELGKRVRKEEKLGERKRVRKEEGRKDEKT